MKPDYGKRDDYFDRHVPGEASSGLRAAVADGDIASGVEGNIYYANAAFAEVTAKAGKAWNDSGVLIPDGAKLYVGRVSPLPGYRIVWAAVCEG